MMALLLMPQDNTIIINFEKKPADGSWEIVNDGVMGGLSQSSMRWSEDGYAVFTGRVSLANNGGFASTRTRGLDLKTKEYKGFKIRIKGDGRVYKMRARTDNQYDGVTYSADFQTETNAWQEIAIPFEDFRPTFRGRTLKDQPPLQGLPLRQLGFLISDKQEGIFKLEIEWIAVY